MGTPDDRTLRKILDELKAQSRSRAVDVGSDRCAKPEIVIKQFPRYPKMSFQQVLQKIAYYPQDGRIVVQSLNIRC